MQFAFFVFPTNVTEEIINCRQTTNNCRRFTDEDERISLTSNAIRIGFFPSILSNLLTECLKISGVLLVKPDSEVLSLFSKPVSFAPSTVVKIGQGSKFQDRELQIIRVRVCSAKSIPQWMADLWVCHGANLARAHQIVVWFPLCALFVGNLEDTDPNWTFWTRGKFLRNANQNYCVFLGF